jgi:hypothetical protein
MLLEPCLYDVVRDHQPALREAAARGDTGTHGLERWQLLLGASTTTARSARSLASRRLGDGAWLACKRGADSAVAGYHV